jgi:hypothetical protein
VALRGASLATDELRQSIAELALRRATPVTTLEETVHTVESTAAVSAAASPSAAAAAQGQAADLEHEQGARLEKAFRAENRDEAWASATEKRIDTALSADGGTNFFSAVECRAAMCRLAGHFDDVASYNQATGTLFMAPYAAVEHGGALTIPDHRPDGSLDVTVYMARPGKTDVLRSPPNRSPTE